MVIGFISIGLAIVLLIIRSKAKKHKGIRKASDVVNEKVYYRYEPRDVYTWELIDESNSDYDVYALNHKGQQVGTLACVYYNVVVKANRDLTASVSRSRKTHVSHWNARSQDGKCFISGDTVWDVVKLFEKYGRSEKRLDVRKGEWKEYS